MKPGFKKYLLAITVVLVLFLGYPYDKKPVPLNGLEVRMISMSGSIDDSNEFAHVHRKPGALNIVARLYFHNKGDLEIPYLTIDSEGNAILHVGVDVRGQLFGTKCEFLRQFEVAIPDEINRKIATLQIFNHDTGQMHEQAIRIGSKEDLDRNLAYSSRMISVEDLTGVHAGC